MAESRKTVTIVFTDVTGSTALGEQTDPEVMRRIMERYFDEMRTVLERHGGTVEKFIGDAVMAVFGIPTVHEDDALRAVRAAAEMRERLAALNAEFEQERGISIAVRTGVNTGEVVAGDASSGQAFATGDAVNVAARLEQAAEPGEILLGPLTHALVQEAVRAEPVEPLELKGKAAAMDAWRLVEALPEVPAFRRRLDAPFVGRDAELATIRAAFDRVRETGSAELVTIIGEPGIGKSRLVRELVASVGDAARVVVGRCLSYGEGITYWPLGEIIRQVAGADARSGLHEILSEDADGVLAAERLLGAIGATDEPARTEEIFWATRVLSERLTRRRPLIAVVDDLHWAEPTLLDLIEYLVGFARAPILIVCTTRPELFDTRPDWPRAGAVELGALGEQQAATLIDALLRDADLAPSVRSRIRERAEGNPLFVEQMLALAEENDEENAAVPATIQALLAARLDHLPGGERAVLVRGSVEGRLFHRGAVSMLLSDGERDGVPARLLALARKNFVRPDESLFPGDDAFRFVHALVRDAAYDAAPKGLRADLHERFAEWVEANAAGLPEAEEILGYHLEQAYRYRDALGTVDDSTRDLARRAGERLAAAGERAFMRGDHGAAVNLFERGIDLLPKDQSRLRLALILGESLIALGRLEEAGDLYARATEEARRAGAESIAMRAELGADVVKMLADPAWASEDTLGLVRRALPVLEAAGDDRGVAQAWQAVHDVEWMRGRLKAAGAASARALVFAERANDIELIARQSEGVGSAMWFGDAPLSAVVDFHERTLEWARRVGHRETEAAMLFVFGRMKIEQGQVDEGRGLVERGLAMVEELGLAVQHAGLLGIFSWAELRADAGDVERRCRTAQETLKRLGQTAFASTNGAWLAFVLAMRGELEEAEALTRESEATGAAEDVTTQAAWRAARAMVFGRTGSFAEARTLGRAAIELADQAEYTELKVFSRLAFADVLQHSGRTADAVELLSEALEIFEGKEMTASAEAVRAQLAELQSSGSPSQ